MFIRKPLTVLLSVVALNLLLAGQVLAGYSYNGRDFSHVPGGDTVAVCDREFDGRNAYAAYSYGSQPASGGIVTDTNGAGSDGCGKESPNGRIHDHRTCEAGNCTDPSNH